MKLNLSTLLASALHNAVAAVVATIVPTLASITDPSQILTGGALAAVAHSPALGVAYGLAFFVARDALAKLYPSFAIAAGKENPPPQSVGK